MTKSTTLTAAIVAVALSSTAAAQNWTNYGGNAARNGQSSVVGPTTTNLLWSDSSYYSIIAWAPFVLDGRVFVIREAGFPASGGAANDLLVAYDLATGTELWTTTLSFGGDTNTEWIAWIGGARDGKVYASRSSHQKPQPIKAFDAATGALAWTSVATTEAWAHDGVVFAPDGDLIVGDFTSVTRIEESDGSTVWSIGRVGSVSGNCGAAATDTAFYIDTVAGGGNRIDKYDLATGAFLYSSPVMAGFTVQNSPFLSADGQTVYFSRTQNNVTVDFLYAFDDDGTQMTQKWSQPVRWTTSHEHGIAPDGSIYTFTQANELVRLDPDTGAITANAGVLSPIGTSNLSPKTAVDALGNVYVSNGWASNPATDGRMWAFSGDLSTNLFTLNLDRQNAGGPALGGSGQLVVADRAGVYCYSAPGTGTAYCFGDPGSGTPCPCANDNDGSVPGSGCANGVFASGAKLVASGAASLSNDTLVLSCTGLEPSNSGLYFQANNDLSPGIVWGDGLQCAGGQLKRLGVRFADATGYSDTSGYAQPISVKAGNIVAGDTKRYQCWYRTTSNPPCGAGVNDFNASNGLAVTWAP